MLQRVVENNAPHTEHAADIVVRHMAPQNAIQWLYLLAESPENQRLAINLASALEKYSG